MASRRTCRPSGTISPVDSADRDELDRGDDARGSGGASGRAPRRRRGGRCASVDDRLVEDLELAAASRPSRRSDGGLEAVDGLCVHVGPVHLEASLAVALGQVHGQVGVAQQFVGRLLRALAERDADAGPHRDVVVMDRGTAASSASAIRPATSSAASGIVPDSTSTANSSPPKRATVSPGRVAARRRSATATSS